MLHARASLDYTYGPVLAARIGHYLRTASYGGAAEVARVLDIDPARVVRLFDGNGNHDMAFAVASVLGIDLSGMVQAYMVDATPYIIPRVQGCQRWTPHSPSRDVWKMDTLRGAYQRIVEFYNPASGLTPPRRYGTLVVLTRAVAERCGHPIKHDTAFRFQALTVEGLRAAYDMLGIGNTPEMDKYTAFEYDPSVQPHMRTSAQRLTRGKRA